MADNEPFGLDPEDLERVLRRAGEQLRSAAGQFSRLFEGAGDRAGWSGLFDERRPHSAPERETAGATGDGVWAIYTVDDDGSARVEQVYATELDALRANSHNTDTRRAVRFLPYGIAVSVLDGTEGAPTSEAT
jgi:hypothetical protein